jgi:hypothetical protein
MAMEKLLIGRFQLIGAIVIILLGFRAVAQTPDPPPAWDLPRQAEEGLMSSSGGRLKIGFESRYRFEDRTGVSFGKDKDQEELLIRNRFSLTWRATDWLTFSGMVQDARAPLYGSLAPSTMRDTADLQEAWVRVGGEAWAGVSFSGGRKMLNYGEGRLIGTPQWSNTSRTYDFASLGWANNGASLELLATSAVKIQSDAFNNPVPGDRVWGYYGTHPWRKHKMTFESYYLRHDQNRIGGFTGGSSAAGTDRLGINTFGGRMLGPLPRGLKFSLEGALQNGKYGSARQRAGAWYTAVSRKWKPGWLTLEALTEYKLASGSGDPSDKSKSGTFDQMYASNHDKFGHEDLFGWRNLSNWKSLLSAGLTRAFTVNYMYDNSWLASSKDALYGSSGKAVLQSKAGTAGRHVGQEHDVFFTWKKGPATFGSGLGYMCAGEFLLKLAPNASPLYVYTFTSYAF